MTDNMNRGELLEKMAASYAAWKALVDRVPRERVTEPGCAGEWSLKDVLAHLTVYERWTADNLEADARGERVLEVVPWGPPDGNTADMDARNAAYYRHFRDTPLDAVLAAAQAHHQRLVAAMPSLGRWSSDFEAIAPFVRSGSFIRMHVEDTLGLTHGTGYLEECITLDGKLAEFSRRPRTGVSEGWDRLA